MGRYRKTRMQRTMIKGKSHLNYDTTYYKKIPERNDDIHVITQNGDRLDSLAFQYYKNPTYWWYIAQANNLFSINVEPGTQLRIPISFDYETVE